jgi:phenylacetic acid degradation operon negative regulatory protein
MAAFVETLLDAFHERTPIRAGSLIITVFGDAVVPRGGVLSLTSLHDIMRAFRISDTLVRTALSRLVSDGWFERWKVGRNSYYRLTGQGHEAFARATLRIYADPPQDWQGAFDLLLLDNGQDRGPLRSELSGAGYGSLGPDLLIAPAMAAESGAFLRLSGMPADLPTARRLAERAWPLAEIESRYRRFIDTYSETLAALERGASFTNLDALLVRILLIHDYRRAVLKDPLLPTQLLPNPWAGSAARDLCGAIYKTLLPAAERWLDAHAQDDRGPLPAVDRDFGRRFAAIRPLAPRQAV